MNGWKWYIQKHVNRDKPDFVTKARMLGLPAGNNTFSNLFPPKTKVSFQKCLGVNLLNFVFKWECYRIEVDSLSECRGKKTISSSLCHFVGGNWEGLLLSLKLKSGETILKLDQVWWNKDWCWCKCLWRLLEAADSDAQTVQLLHRRGGRMHFQAEGWIRRS